MQTDATGSGTSEIDGSSADGFAGAYTRLEDANTWNGGVLVGTTD